MNLIDRLAAIDLFRHQSRENLEAVAALAREHQIPAGTTLSRQADLGTTFFVIDSGEATIRRVDDKGFSRPVGTIRDGDHYGISSLLVSEPRDATVISRTPMRLWTIEREAFESLLNSRPSVRRNLAVPADIVQRGRLPRFDWLTPSESVVYYCHRHWLPLVRALLIGTVVTVALLLLLPVALRSVDKSWDPTVWLLVIGGAYLVFVIWHWFDWVNDQMVVTTRRISYREQLALFYEVRNELPIDRVQNINIVSTLLGRLFGYGTMAIQTASETGTLLLEQLPHPERVRDAIWSQTERTRATQRATERRLMTDALASQLGLDISEELDRSGNGDLNGGHESPPQIVEDPGPAGAWRALLGRFRRPQRGEQRPPDRVVWRKHWIFLAGVLLLPLFVLLIALVIVALAWMGMPAPVAGAAWYLGLVHVLAVMALFWVVWEAVDWSNDRYIVTSDRIIDVEQRPFSLHSEQREANLGTVQNVRLEVPHFWAVIWGYGNVIVQTAGPGDFTFDRVPQPSRVQAEIFRRIEAFREKERERETIQRRQEMAEWFSVYRDLSGAVGEEDYPGGQAGEYHVQPDSPSGNGRS